MTVEYAETIQTPKTNSKSRKMKKPKYSSIEWTTHDKYKVTVNKANTIMKGTFNQLKEMEKQAHSSWVFDNEKKEYKLKTRNEKINKYDGGGVIKIGNSLYYRGFIYAILEEIIGEKILRKDWSRPIKKVCGRIFVLHTRQKLEENNLLIIEGNNGYYAVAPRIERD